MALPDTQRDSWYQSFSERESKVCLMCSVTTAISAVELMLYLILRVINWCQCIWSDALFDT